MDAQRIITVNHSATLYFSESSIMIGNFRAVLADGHWELEQWNEDDGEWFLLGCSKTPIALEIEALVIPAIQKRGYQQIQSIQVSAKTAVLLIAQGRINKQGIIWQRELGMADGVDFWGHKFCVIINPNMTSDFCLNLMVKQ